MGIIAEDSTTFLPEDTRRLFYVRNYERVLKMTFRYLGKYEVAVATVHDAFLRLFRYMGPHGEPCDVRWVKDLFIKAAVNAALKGAARDTVRVRAGYVQIYLRELAVWEGDGTDLAMHRHVIAQLLQLPLYPRLAYNICIIEGYSGREAAGLLGINESQVARYVRRARALLKKLS